MTYLTPSKEDTVSLTIGDLTRKQEQVATWEYVAHVARSLGIDDQARAQYVADFIVNEIENVGAASAVPYFDDDGSGPWCSWCGRLSGLCSHIAGAPERKGGDNA